MGAHPPCPSPRVGARWRGFGRTALGAALGLLVGYLALAWIVDPYDSGRSRVLSAGAVRPQGPRTAVALRGRDPAFAGAVIGNSHIQLVEPARLSAATGIPFVQLAIPATGPAEQLDVLAWFLGHHPAPEAVVMALDDFWCTDDPQLPNDKPFPFWLLADDPLAYLRGLLRFSVAEEVVGRVGWLVGGGRPTARPDGWWDYEPDYLRQGYGRDPRLLAERTRPAPAQAEPGKAGPFPAAARLRQAVARLPEATALVVVFPPIVAAALPPPGSPRARAEAGCKAALAGALDDRGRSAVLDWRRDRPEARDPVAFLDRSHYRHPLARALTEDIAAALRRLRADEAG